MKFKLLFLIIIVFTLTACSSFSVSNQGAKVTVGNKAKQPDVIVNGQINATDKP